LTLRGAAAVGALVLLTGCVAAPQPRAQPTARPQTEPASPPPPAAVPPAATFAPASTGFVLHGALSQGGMVIGTAPAGTVSLTLDGAAVPLAPDGRFLIAFGRDHGPGATLVATRRDGAAITDPLAIAPGTYRIEALPIPKYQQPAAEFLRIREGELAQIKAARETAAGVRSDGWRQTFLWPVTGRVSGAFGAQRVYNGEKGSYHSGEDVAVPEGTPVRAPADGVVLLAVTGEPFTLEGYLLMVGHGMGLDSAFLHLSRIVVQPGETVRQGQVIGYSGKTGRATGPHLHWALTWRGERIDPKLVAGAMVTP
jgi:murein DD-endopeptidase MepM/ murein hydrolase activator NlpD